MLVCLCCHMDSIPADAFIWVGTNWHTRIPAHSILAKQVITSNTTARLLHRCSVISCPLINPHIIYIYIYIYIYISSCMCILCLLSLIELLQRLTKAWSLTENPLESVVIITIYNNNTRIFFSQNFNGLFQLIIVIYCQSIQPL
jgi:hypothetical protein